jgi:hypothetical protein
MDDLEKSLAFPFRDGNWVLKFIIGIAFMLLSIIGLGLPVMAGYYVQTVRRSMRDEDPALPEWTDIGIMFVTGFKFCVVYVLYLLPAILLVLPALLIGVVAGVGELPEGFGAIVTIYTFGMLLIYIPYVLAFTLLSPVITCRFALNERISEALDIGAVLRDFRAVWPTATVTVLLTILLQTLAWAGIFLFLIGVLVTIFYSVVVSAHLFGAVHRVRVREGAAA